MKFADNYIHLPRIKFKHMKSILTKISLAIALLFAVQFIHAQVAKDEVQLVQNIWGLEKRAIVNDYMKFTEAEATKFNPIYEMYADESKALGAERIQIISEYANNYASLTDVKADELVKRTLKNNASMDKLQAKYYGKMKKALGAMRAAQFMQLDSYLQTMVRAEIQNNIPLIGELDKKAK